ncbi:unnamed protein product, partial [Onchocerca flexuosa]|uniref:Uncharacterized protein n=1 Tax=Onchocerca flexuosa TaxID=387005 RepID=A0A183HRV4_9BILA
MFKIGVKYCIAGEMDLNLGGSKKKQHHVRKKYSIITLDLFKPTKKSYPEFDYEKICKEYLKEDESSGEDERFHDREAEELVKRLEQKYVCLVIAFSPIT